MTNAHRMETLSDIIKAIAPALEQSETGGIPQWFRVLDGGTVTETPHGWDAVSILAELIDVDGCVAFIAYIDFRHTEDGADAEQPVASVSMSEGDYDSADHNSFDLEWHATDATPFAELFAGSTLATPQSRVK